MNRITLSSRDFLPIVGGSDVFIKSRKYMRGAGLFSSIGAFLLPILRSLSGYALSTAANFAGDTSAALAEGKSVKDSVKSSAQKTIRKVGSDIQTKLRGGARGGVRTRRGRITKPYREAFSR
jgi:hypothetical protein